jgi:hypothetical protein
LGDALPLFVFVFVTRKCFALVAVPVGVVMLIEPLVAPFGTTAVISEPEVAVKEAAVPSNVTAVAPVRFEPLIVTAVPGDPLAGENELIVGGVIVGVGTVTVKLAELVAVPPGVVTLIGPLVAPLGTVDVI